MITIKNGASCGMIPKKQSFIFLPLPVKIDLQGKNDRASSKNVSLAMKELIRDCLSEDGNVAIFLKIYCFDQIG